MTSQHPPLRLGLVGYGVGGRCFHAPFIEAAGDVELAGVVTRDAARRAQVDTDHPGVEVYDSLADLLASGRIDVVTVSTPPGTHRRLALEAVAAGVHVVVDKPFAPSAAVAMELEAAARDAGVLLSVFHNRRWDADIRTLAAVLDSGRLGEVWRVHSRFDLDDPATLETGPHGGMLRDLGSHVVDQMLALLGPVDRVLAHLDHVDLPQGRTDAGFVMTLHHESGVVSQVESSKLNRISQRELRAYGSAGSYRSLGTDVQAQAIFAGRRPVDDPAAWGYEAEERWGVLSTAAGEERVPSEQGAYHHFYERFAAAVRGDGGQPVPAAEGVATMRVLDAARRSAIEGREVNLK